MKKEFLLYIAVSGIAWLVDVAVLFVAALYLGLPNYLAAAIAYAIGLVVHYVLSVRFVFTYRRMAAHSPAEMLLYALTGVVGIALSAVIVYAGTLLGSPLIWSKVAATLVAFVIVYVIRKITLFSTHKNNRGLAP